jgi:hypothetical protein
MIYIYANNLVTAHIYASTNLKLKKTGHNTYDGACIVSSPVQLEGAERDEGELRIVGPQNTHTQNMVDKAHERGMEVVLV